MLFEDRGYHNDSIESIFTIGKSQAKVAMPILQMALIDQRICKSISQRDSVSTSNSPPE